MHNSLRVLVIVLALVLLTACAKAVEPNIVAQPTTETQNEILPTNAATDAPTDAAPTSQATVSSSSPVEPPAVAPAEPDSVSVQGQALLDERCTVCHTLDRVTSMTASSDEWETIVIDMIRRGASLTDEEKAILVQFLAENYGN